MKNSLGNPARGDAFYDREREIRKIYRVLETGASIYLSAPRRVGKTSVLKHLEEFPEDGYCFIYIITESVDNTNEYFKTIFDELVKSEAIKRLSKISNTIKDVATALLSKVKSVNGVELREGEDSNYYELLVELFTNIAKEQGRVVLMIDEFPQTIQNIFDKDKQAIAQQFIQKNRELRHHKNVLEKVSFIYTGSVSLFPMVEKVTSLTSINDLRTVDLDPLELTDAREFLRLLLQNDGIFLNEEISNYALSKIGWLIPFHIQLIEQEIVDVYEARSAKIDSDSIDKAFDQVVHSRNKPQFEPYFSRLTKIFKNQEYQFVMEVLKYVAKNDTIDDAIINDLGVKYNIVEIKNIIQLLEGDGYLFLKNGSYRYTSPILQLWCKKHICK